MPMLPVPLPILTKFNAILGKQAVPSTLRADYKKWLRYFLDFCNKYSVPETRPDQVRLFIDKLREKKQTLAQQKQAAQAVSLYFEIQSKGNTQGKDIKTPTTSSGVLLPLQVRERPPSFPQSVPPKTHSSVLPAQRQPWRLWEDGYAVQSESPEWDAAIADLAAEIKTRHYSRKTLKTYAHWSRQFQRFLKNKPPKSLSSRECQGIPDLSRGSMPCFRLHSESGLSCPSFSVPPCPQAGFRRLQRRSPGKKVKIYPGSPFTKGDRERPEAPPISL